MPKYKVTVAYDGTDYAGWQAQPGHTTVEGVIRTLFAKIFKTDCSVLAASRTDAGVHASGNVMRIETEIALDPQKLMYAFNNVLPADIVIKDVVRDDAFHPFYNVASKEYHYHFFTKRPSPFVARYGWFVAQPIDYNKLQLVLELYRGTYDFSQFTSTGDTRIDKVRTIDAIYLEKDGLFGAERVVLVGKKFLHTMVRRMVGTALYVATQSHACLDLVKKMLEEQLKTEYTLKAPAQGLMLHAIKYNDNLINKDL